MTSVKVENKLFHTQHSYIKKHFCEGIETFIL